MTVSQLSLHSSLHLNTPSHTKHPAESFPWDIPSGPSTSETSDAISLSATELELEHICSIFILHFALCYESLMFWMKFPTHSPTPSFLTQRHFSLSNLLVTCLLLFPSHYLPFPIPTHSPPNSQAGASLLLIRVLLCTSLTAASIHTWLSSHFLVHLGEEVSHHHTSLVETVALDAVEVFLLLNYNRNSHF